jgi:hypothetical protein
MKHARPRYPLGWAGSTRVNAQRSPARRMALNTPGCVPGRNRTFFVVGFRRLGRNAFGNSELQQYSCVPFPRDLATAFYWLGCLGACHSLILPSSLPDARIMPSGENATARTGALCPLKLSSS